MKAAKNKNFYGHIFYWNWNVRRRLIYFKFSNAERMADVHSSQEFEKDKNRKLCKMGGAERVTMLK
jgi:hypothetical protein